MGLRIGREVGLLSICHPQSGLTSGMGNFRINPDFRIENFHFKHEISLLLLFTKPSFCVSLCYLG